MYQKGNVIQLISPLIFLYIQRGKDPQWYAVHEGDATMFN